MQHSFIKIPEVCRRTGLGKSTIYKYISEGKFPKQIKVGSHASAFVESEVDTWINRRIIASRTEARNG
ncbi:AlpA family transcriptional regulator [Xenorhabdus bovienii]|uniref:helix-turn-helix transcriptional regulator n=1 Tax=Xenorhabdus bovienii TaxID=40576 RepID=UPI0023B2D70D|nr:AlpA family transcriptional regulator [Xenorhabdus bovienii]MDE9430059.1 AlpA family transcriptional regulator [Xenorhabdus bovienii]MDE9455832.1 AlpA family transcriptional regulator [Xenorhabdus bovienii]MDE9557266.1 AlpA family transcriptional regulator [Xenorhabdus bovienii]